MKRIIMRTWVRSCHRNVFRIRNNQRYFRDHCWDTDVRSYTRKEKWSSIRCVRFNMCKRVHVYAHAKVYARKWDMQIISISSSSHTSHWLPCRCTNTRSLAPNHVTAEGHFRPRAQGPTRHYSPACVFVWWVLEWKSNIRKAPKCVHARLRCARLSPSLSLPRWLLQCQKAVRSSTDKHTNMFSVSTQNFYWE